MKTTKSKYEAFIKSTPQEALFYALQSAMTHEKLNQLVQRIPSVCKTQDEANELQNEAAHRLAMLNALENN